MRQSRQKRSLSLTKIGNWPKRLVMTNSSFFAFNVGYLAILERSEIVEIWLEGD